MICRPPVKHVWLAAAVVLAASAGCASVRDAAPTASAPGSAAPKPQPRPVSAPRFNLTGFSDAYRTGHSDACAGRRDAARFNADGDYSMGWNDGRLACGR
jgi:hypothetical protein